MMVFPEAHALAELHEADIWMEAGNGPRRLWREFQA
jgi:hypothetical protein